MSSSTNITLLSLTKNIRKDLQNPHFVEKYANHESSLARYIARLLWTFKEPGSFEDYLKKELEKSQLENEEIIRVLRCYKWLVPISMPMDILLEVVKIAKSKGNHRAEINQLFIEYFSHSNFEALLNLIETWKSNPIFSRRIKIFHDCVSALKTETRNFNPSNVVLPTLISQIDGVLNDYAEQLGIKIKRKEKKKWDEEFRNKTANQIGYSEISNSANDILLDVLFQSAFPRQPLQSPFSFNRHKILHGEFTNYGRLDNTLRAFLILDFLHFASNKGKL